MGILFMRAITLDGAGLGIYHFFHIKPESFLNSETWIDSATQVSMNNIVHGSANFINCTFLKFKVFDEFFFLLF